ncbi:zinc finger, CCHC-type containing protein [Tanacetum coccineum]
MPFSNVTIQMVDSRPVMEQYNELLRILGQYTQHGLKIDESISVSSIIDKLPPSWKDFKHTLKHGKDDLSLVQLGSHLRIEESLRAQDSDKGKGKEVAGPSVNMTEEGKNKNNKQNKGKKRDFKEHGSGSGSNKKPKLECWKCGKTGHFKRDCRSGNKKNANCWCSEGVDAIAWWIDSGATTHVCKDRCWFKTYEPVEDGSVLYMGDDHFAHVHRKGSVDFVYYNNGMFMLNLNKVPNDSDSVYMSSSAVVNSSLWPLLVIGSDQNQVDKTKKFLSSRFLMKDMREADVNLAIKIKRKNKRIKSYKPKYKVNRDVGTARIIQDAIGLLMYAMTSTRPDIAYAVGRLSRFTSNPSRQHWQAITRVFKFIFYEWMGVPAWGGVISWASKKQTCITGSTMESEFVALAAAGKEAEWLRNLIHEIPIWPKPIAPISI